jgi:hypothetical protein
MLKRHKLNYVKRKTRTVFGMNIARLILIDQDEIMRGQNMKKLAMAGTDG